MNYDTCNTFNQYKLDQGNAVWASSSTPFLQSCSGAGCIGIGRSAWEGR